MYKQLVDANSTIFNVPPYGIYVTTSLNLSHNWLYLNHTQKLTVIPLHVHCIIIDTVFNFFALNNEKVGIIIQTDKYDRNKIKICLKYHWEKSSALCQPQGPPTIIVPTLLCIYLVGDVINAG